MAINGGIGNLICEGDVETGGGGIQLSKEKHMIPRNLISVILTLVLCTQEMAGAQDAAPSPESPVELTKKAVNQYLAELDAIERAAAEQRAAAQARLHDALAAISAVTEEQPRKLPILSQGKPEESLRGIVTATSGRVVVLEHDQWFSVNKHTQYFKVTPFDLMEVDADSMRPGVPVSAVGKPDVDGEFVASRVIVLQFLPASAAPSGPDRMEWVTDGVVEGVETKWILLDKQRRIPIGEETKFYVTRGGKNEPADLASVSIGAVIDFNLSGRPAVLKGLEAGDVTTVWVVVRENR
jgi:hypothetical protein